VAVWSGTAAYSPCADAIRLNSAQNSSSLAVGTVTVSVSVGAADGGGDPSFSSSPREG